MNAIVLPHGAHTPFVDKPYDVNVHADIKCGVGGVGVSEGKVVRYRDLTLDIYEPVGDGVDRRPALILAFGGAFHRGSKKDDVVVEGEHRNTPISEYCREFARRGYVCFSIDYRLMQEQPDPGHTPTLPPDVSLNLDRVNHVRGILGLAPCTPQMMADEIEAATDDMTHAVAFVRSRAHSMRIDVNRVAIGGFSSGAIIALNSAFAEHAPVAAVVALSGRMSMATAESCVAGRPDEPAVITFIGQDDLPAMLEGLEGPVAHLRKMGITYDVVRIDGATHFYPRTADISAPDGRRTDVESVLAEFLYRHLDLHLCNFSPR